MATSTGQLEYKPTERHVPLIWTIKDFESLVNPPDGGKVVKWSPLIDGRWKIQLSRNTEPDETGMGLFLYAIPTEADRRNRTKELEWIREGRTNGTFSLLKFGDKASVTETLEKPDNFRSRASNWGMDDFATAEELKDASETTGSIRLSITLKTTGVDYSSSCNSYLLIFDDPRCSDVVFSIRPDQDSPVRRIFAIKSILSTRCDYFKTLFSSGFLESHSFVSLDSTKSKQEILLEDEDEDDLGPFEPASNLPLDSVMEEKMAREEDNFEKSEFLHVDLRRYLEIKVEETPFLAFRAMIGWIYSNSISFLPLPSEWLVARQSAPSTSEDQEDTPTLTSRAKWLRKEFSKSGRQPFPVGIEPCSSHAVYRLADRYDLVELRNLAKAHIVDGLNIQNVSYELFSPLSLTFPDIQDAVLKFFMENWISVEKTPAFDAVLAHSYDGDLPEARSLMKTILSTVTKKLSDQVAKENSNVDEPT